MIVSRERTPVEGQPSEGAPPRPRNQTLRLTQSRLAGLFVFALIAVVFANWLLFRSAISRADELGAFSNETRSRDASASLAVALREAEANHAAAIALRSPLYRARFEIARRDLAESLDQLRRLQGLAPNRAAEIDALEADLRRIETRFQEADALSRSGRVADAIARISRPDIVDEQRRVEALAREIRQRDSLLLTRRLAQIDRDLERARTQNLAWSAVLAAFLGLLYLILRRDLHIQGNDTAALRAANERLAALAEEDGLTGLKNRRAFEEHMAREWRRSERHAVPLSMLLLDVDHFKRYNDAFGHPSGDQILKTLSAALLETARTTDFVARYGGEEFALLLPHTDANEAVVVGERLRSLLSRTAWPHRAITISVGAATRTAEMPSPADLVKAADLALYYAKQNGRNRVIHFQRIG